MASKRKKKPTTHTLGIGYLRVSTEDQPFGCDAQRAMITADALRRGVHVASWHADIGVSGTLPLARRPALLEALSAMRSARATLLFVAKADRLTRAGNTQAEALAYAVYKHGGSIAYADGTPESDTASGRFQRSVMVAVAALERDYISERTTAALAVKKARGERTGRIPYGFQLAPDGIHLEPDPAETARIAELVTLRKSGLSLRAICAELDKSGPPRDSKRWHRTTIVEILAR